MKKQDNPRSKYFTIELYPESENICFNDKIELIKKYNYAYILHDKDNVGSHYHVVVAFDNYRYKNAISEEFNIPTNYIEVVRSLDAILTYLIHLNDKSKYQYNFEEVQGSQKLLIKLQKALKNNALEEEDKILQIVEWIDGQGHITMSRFVRYMCSIGRYDILRRSQFIFTTMIKEHNDNVTLYLEDEKISWYVES